MGNYLLKLVNLLLILVVIFLWCQQSKGQLYEGDDLDLEAFEQNDIEFVLRRQSSKQEDDLPKKKIEKRDLSYYQYYDRSLHKPKEQNCPKVKSVRNFNLNEFMGAWHVVQYYASSEEAEEYACMRSVFSMTNDNAMYEVTMNFTYLYADDPDKDELRGNITWSVPDPSQPAHWLHTEHIYEGIYNTDVIDTDYTTWALVMHCAEKYKSPRYLSALLLARGKTLTDNVINFLREKLPRYDIDTSFMFPIKQDSCEIADSTYEPDSETVTESLPKHRNKRNRSKGKNPLKAKRRNRIKQNNQL